MTDVPIPSPGGLTVPTNYEIPALGGIPSAPIGQPCNIAAAGGSIINSGTVTCYFSAGPNPLDANAVAIAPGGTLPWPQGVPCWAWTLAGGGTTGNVIVMPIQLPYSPGGLGGQPVTIVNPSVDVNLSTLVANATSTGEMINTPSSGGFSQWVLETADLQPVATQAVWLINGLSSGNCYGALSSDGKQGDHANLQMVVGEAIVGDLAIGTPNQSQLIIRYRGE